MDEPLSNEELATAKGQMLIAGSLANNRNASVDIPTMLAGVRRMLATIDARDSTIATLTAERDKAEAALEMVKALADGYGWLSEGRGPYAYDDAHYDDDVRTFVGQLLEMLPSGNWLSMPAWEAKFRATEAERDRLRGLLAHVRCEGCGSSPAEDPTWVWCAAGSSYANGHVLGQPEPYPCGPVELGALAGTGETP